MKFTEEAMARLLMQLLGSFQVGLAQSPVTNFESNKARALLAYLAVENASPQPRELLVEMFWPEMEPGQGSANLSRTIYNLRGLIGDRHVEPAYLIRSRQNLQFNPESDFWLDVKTFKDGLDGVKIDDFSPIRLDAGDIKRLQAAVDLYRGDFLEGLTFNSSLLFDEWLMVMRSRFQRQVLAGLHLLAAHHAQQGEIAVALPFAWRRVEMDPLDERGCRLLMRLLVASDQRNQALAQFEQLQKTLMEVLDVAPEPETLKLRDQIHGNGSKPIPSSPRRNSQTALLTSTIAYRPERVEIRERNKNMDNKLLPGLGSNGNGNGNGNGKPHPVVQADQTCLERYHLGVTFGIKSCCWCLTDSSTCWQSRAGWRRSCIRQRGLRS